MSKVAKFNTKHNSNKRRIWSFFSFRRNVSSFQSVCLVPASADISATFVWSSKRTLIETGLVDKGSLMNTWPTLPKDKVYRNTAPAVSRWNSKVLYTNLKKGVGGITRNYPPQYSLPPTIRSSFALRPNKTMAVKQSAGEHSTSVYQTLGYSQ